MSCIEFRYLMCLQNNKTGQIAYMGHPTDCALLCSEEISGNFRFDESAIVPLMKDHKMHMVRAFRKDDKWFVMENEFVRLS